MTDKVFMAGRQAARVATAPFSALNTLAGDMRFWIAAVAMNGAVWGWALYGG